MSSFAARGLVDVRWIWIDRIVDFEPDQRLCAIKNISMGEELLHEHFGAEPGRLPDMVMPFSIIIEGMAQTAGILVGSAKGFREKVVLAKIVRARLDRDVGPGDCLRYEATIDRIDALGASARGVVKLLDHATSTWNEIGVVHLLFSHVDQNRSGLAFPEHNFVFDGHLVHILMTYDHERLRLPDHVPAAISS